MSQSLAAKLEQIDWDFPDSDTGESIHSIHPYPARFIPEIPRTLIEMIGLPKGTWILDPFCGSGATLVESQSAGYPALGIDLNPIACLISRVKTRPPPINLAEHAANAVIAARMTSRAAILPNIPNLDHWFRLDVQDATARLLREIDLLSFEDVRDALRLALSSILVRVSNQESDTRYAAIEKVIDSEKVYSLFLAAAERIAAAKRAYQPKNMGVEIICKDILQVTPDEILHPVGLVVTSPPYPNAYEYWLYHKYRMFWLGYDPIAVKEQEIGARAHYFKKNYPTEQDFRRQMLTILELLWKVVVCDGHVCIVIGRSKIHGKIVDNAEILKQLANDLGFRLVVDLPRQIARSRKAFNLSHANILTENILVFCKPTS